MQRIHQKNRKLVRNLLLGSVMMFGFGFALVPLYDVFCEITGLNGKVTSRGPDKALQVDRSRTVTLQLIAVNNEAMPWGFNPVTEQIAIHPGLTGQTAFVARNPTARTMIGQAIPSVAPSEAASYLHKINCFCFESQSLSGGEEREMPLLFVIDPDLPAHISTITLSYTLFDITPQQKVGYIQPVRAQRFSL